MGVAAPTGLTELVWAQYIGFLAESIPASTWPGAATQPEIADDIEFEGAVHRVTVNTQLCYQCPGPVAPSARVRFFEWTENGPGALQHEVTVHDVEYGGLLQIDLPAPFVATGRHFLSVQVQASGPNGLEWVSTGDEPEELSKAWYRDESQTSAWGAWLVGGAPFGGDMAFQLHGIPAPADPPAPAGDPCGPWKATDVPYAANVSHSVLRDVKVFAPDDVWAVGTRLLQVGLLPSQIKSGTVSLHFDGTAWTEIDTPSPEPYAGAGGAGLWAVDGVAPDDVWAAGSQQLQGSGGFVGTQSLLMRWDGAQWSVVDSPVTPGVPGTLQGTSGSIVRDVEVLAEDDVWFVGDWAQPFACQMALAMHWDGSGFTVYDTPCAELPASTDGFGLESVSAVAPDDVNAGVCFGSPWGPTSPSASPPRYSSGSDAEGASVGCRSRRNCLVLDSGSGWLDREHHVFVDHFAQAEVLNACYAHAWDESGTRLLVAGGPLAYGLRGCYVGVWS